MKKMATLLLSLSALLITLLSPFYSHAQSTVVIAGNFQSELGCPGDWQPDCDATRLTQTSTGIWEGTFFIPEGTWQFKVTIDNSWNENYGAGGLPGGPNIAVGAISPSFIKFTYNHFTHLVEITNLNLSVNLAGSFQSELFCAGDWQADCIETRLEYDPITQNWFGTFVIPAGNWEYKITHNSSWDENYGEGGVPGGANMVLNLSELTRIRFQYNPVTHISTTTEVDMAVILAGDFQSELGCAGDWLPNCPYTALTYNAPQNLWQGQLTLPPGNWAFKTTIDNSWDENYGEGGLPGGANMLLNLPQVSRVSFTYNPVTHITTYNAEPITVVLTSDFQSELGCTPQVFTGDWEPACDITRLSYDAANRIWKGTFDIAAGNWHYKVALNNSWDENYGMEGERDGQNYILQLETAARVTFYYWPQSHLITIGFNTTGLCGVAFYDANVNGFNDDEMPLKGITFTLSGNSTGTTKSGSDGKGCFANLPQGAYSIAATIPSRFLPTTATLQSKYLPEPQTMPFGMVCLGGAGAEDKGFWTSKKGKAVFDAAWNKDQILQAMYYLNLVSADGSHFKPKNYNDLVAWMKKANAKNMSYMTSAQLAALFLSVETGLVQSHRIVYTPSFGNRGYYLDFRDVYSLIWYTAGKLANYPLLRGGHAERKTMEKLKDLLEKANHDLNFVQEQPCSSHYNPEAARGQQTVVEQEAVKVDIWPNPSGTYFNLRPANSGKQGNVQVRVMDVNGKLVYTATGSAQQEYRFGENFRPGLYLVEITQVNSRTTVKVVKQ